MRWARRLLATLLALAVLMTTAAAALAKGSKGHDGKDRDGWPEHRFSDWNEGHWANESLLRLLFMGVIKGNADGTLRPNQPVSRLEAAIMLARYLDAEEGGTGAGGRWVFVVGGRKKEFTLIRLDDGLRIHWEDDEIKVINGSGRVVAEYEGTVPAWGRAAVTAALRLGFLITDGKKLELHKPLTRLEAAVMLVKAAGLDAEARALAGVELPFRDTKAIPAALRGYVQIAVENGLITGYTDRTFQPHKKVTRAEWAVLLDRFDRRAEVPPGRYQVRGELTAVDASRVAVGGKSYPLAGTIWVYVDGRRARLADLQVGDRVLLQLNLDGEVIMIVRLAAARTRTEPGAAATRLEGTVVRVDGAERRLQLQVGTQSYVVAYTDTTAVTYGNLPLSPAALAEGQELTAEGTLSGTVLTAGRIAINPARSTVRFEAVYRGREAGKVRLTLGQGTYTLPLAAGATFTALGLDLDPDLLQEGDGVRLTADRGAVTQVELLSREGVSWSGTVTAVDPAQHTFRMVTFLPGTSRSATVTVRWSPATRFTAGDGAAGAGDLAAGTAVLVTGNLTGGTTVEAAEIFLP